MHHPAVLHRANPVHRACWMLLSQEVACYCLTSLITERQVYARFLVCFAVLSGQADACLSWHCTHTHTHCGT